VRIALAGFDHLASKLFTNKHGRNTCIKLWKLWKTKGNVTVLEHQRQDVGNLGLVVAEILEIETAPIGKI
jgi:hypothetical protein